MLASRRNNQTEKLFICLEAPEKLDGALAGISLSNEVVLSAASSIMIAGRQCKIKTLTKENIFKNLKIIELVLWHQGLSDYL